MSIKSTGKGTSFTVFYLIVGIASDAVMTRSKYFEYVGDVIGANSELVRAVLVSKKLGCALMCVEKTGCEGFSVRRVNENELYCILSLDRGDLDSATWQLHWTGRTLPSDICRVTNAAIPFIRRVDGSVDFSGKYWVDYREGFGNPHDTMAEFWLGLETLHNVTYTDRYGLKVSMLSWNHEVFCGYYSHFQIGPESDKYRLDVSGYDAAMSNSGDGLTNPIEPHQSMAFTTRDQDNGVAAGCWGKYKGAFWMNSCHFTQPTGLYFLGGVAGMGNPDSATGIDWRAAYGYHYSFRYMEFALTPN